MNSNIINKAIATVNDDVTLEAVRKAQGIIGNITREQKQREVVVKQLTENQAALRKMEESELTFEQVYGAPKPATPTTTQATIIKAIEELVKGKQGEVEVKCHSLASTNARLKADIDAIDARIAGLRSQLDKVSPELVTAQTIVGSGE